MKKVQHGDVATVTLSVRIRPELRQRVKAAADASNASISYYVDELLAQLIAQNNGELPPVGDREPQQESLPVNKT